MMPCMRGAATVRKKPTAGRRRRNAHSHDLRFIHDELLEEYGPALTTAPCAESTVKDLRSSGSGRISRQLPSYIGPKPVPGGRQKSDARFVCVRAAPDAWAAASGAVKVMPVPASDTGAALAWALASGAARLTVLAPKLLGVTPVTVAFSASTVIVSPARIQVTSLTRTLVAPVAAAPPSVVRVVGVPTPAIVGVSFWSVIVEPCVNALTAATFTFLAPAATAPVSVVVPCWQHASSAAPSL